MSQFFLDGNRNVHAGRVQSAPELVFLYKIIEVLHSYLKMIEKRVAFHGCAQSINGLSLGTLAGKISEVFLFSLSDAGREIFVPLERIRSIRSDMTRD